MTQIAHSKLTAKRPWMFKSRWRLFLTLFVLIAIPTAILTSLTALFVSAELTEQAITQNQLTARLVARQLEEEFFGLRRYMESFATRRRLIDSVSENDPAVVQDQLMELVNLNHKVSRVILTDLQGILRFDYPNDASAAGANLSDRDWFKGVSQSDQPYVSEVYERVTFDRSSIVTIASKIKDDDGRTIAYLGGQYTIRDLMQWLDSVRPSDLNRIALFDHRGNQVLRLSAAEHKIISDHPMIPNILKKPEGSLHVDNLDGFDRCFVTHVPVKEIGWTVISYQDDEVVFAPVARVFRMMLVFFIVALGVLGALGWLWYRVLFAYAEDLHRSNKELENFCYSIAHDLRAPLRAMQGFTDALLDEYATKLDETGKDYAARIGSAARRMDRLIMTLLEYGEVAHGSLTFESADLDESMETTVQLFADDIQQKRAGINIRKPLGIISCDRQLLEQVLKHLLSNALKYSAENTPPRIDIWSEDKGKNLQIWIKDNGTGIDPAYHERIFGVFQQLHAYDEFSGTGIGLAIVRKAIERMGGNVGVESQAGKGSAFWFTLPKK